MPRRGERSVAFACDKGRQCSAKSKRSGKRCRNYACQDRETCRMHGGTSRRGREHPNYKTGRYSKQLRKIGAKLTRALQRPIEVKIALYPEGFVETMERPWRERYFVLVSFPDDLGLPLHEQERILKAARREISSYLRQVRDELAGNPNELEEEE